MVTSLSFGQNLAVNGGFENWTTGVPDSWPVIDFNTTDLTQDMTTTTEGASSASVNLMTQSQANTDIRQTISLTGGATYTVSLDVYATDNQARARIFGPGFTPSQYSDETILNQWQTITFDYTPAATGDAEFGIRFYDISANWLGTGSQFYIDNFQVVEQVAPSIAITSPADGSTGTSTDVTISLAVNNFVVDAVNDGNGGHIHYTVDGGGVIMKYDTNDIILTGLSLGAHTVVATLVDDTHSPIAGPVDATVNFTIAGVTPVNDIATLRAGTINDYYELTSEAFLTYQQSFRNQKFIEDATAAILIDDTAGNITTMYNRGDGISGITGQLTTFGGMMQFIPTEDPGIASSTGGGITPQTVTLANLSAAPENYESELVNVVAVDMDNTTPNFAGGSEHQMTQGADNFTFRSSFFDANYAANGAEVPTTATNVTGIINERSGSLYYLTARDSDDFSVVLSVADNTIDGFSIYPNPSNSGVINITTRANQIKNVQIFDMLGKKVIEKKTTATVNISALQAGIYIVKVTENNVSATKRLVVR